MTGLVVHPGTSGCTGILGIWLYSKKPGEPRIAVDCTGWPAVRVSGGGSGTRGNGVRGHGRPVVPHRGKGPGPPIHHCTALLTTVRLC